MDSVQKDHEAALQYDFRAWKDRAEKAEATIKAIGELHDRWLQQNKNVEINLVTVEAECGDAYDWRLRMWTRKQCAGDLEAILNRSAAG